MKKLGKYDTEFPETIEEHKAWEPIVAFTALHTKVLVAARTRVEGAWCAYCRNCPGLNHADEIYDVLAHGQKLEESVARTLFPQFAGIPYAR